MGEDLQRAIETVLNGTTSKTGISIKLLAQMVDTKFSSMDAENKQRHEELLAAISDNKKKTDDRFKGLEVVSFFSKYPKAFWLVVSAVLVLVGSGLQNIFTSLIK
jgi:uncharacterized protein YegL